MSYYLFTGRSYFARTHLVVGYGDWYVSGCGLKWRRATNAWKEVKRERVYPLNPRAKSGGSTSWPEPKALGVTCAHCLQNGYPPHRWPKRTLPPDTGGNIVGPEDVHRGE